jgi:hypothetical protein
MKTSENFNKINSEILSGNTNEKTLKKPKTGFSWLITGKQMNKKCPTG